MPSCRLLAVGLDNTQETRRAFREVLFTAPDIGKYLGGVICFEETLVQTAKDGTKFTELLRMQGVLPGVKVDRGLRPLPGSDGETYTEGAFDSFEERSLRAERLANIPHVSSRSRLTPPSLISRPRWPAREVRKVLYRRRTLCKMEGSPQDRPSEELAISRGYCRECDWTSAIRCNRSGEWLGPNRRTRDSHRRSPRYRGFG
mmetsp:Transcript_12273/g.25041  ORF Transcript_12273/g.25041 Transcript_12273/m.25041 type:complete len:202 (+) Transcript_12273:214-819(+)